MKKERCKWCKHYEAIQDGYCKDCNDTLDRNFNNAVKHINKPSK